MRPCGELKLLGGLYVSEGGCLFWGGIAVGIWMIFDVGHAFCILSVIGFDQWIYENSPGGRLLNATTNINMSITGHKTSPLCSPSTPNKDAWPRFRVIEAADDDHRPLTERMDVFALHKAIEGMSGPHESVKPMNNGKQVLVHFENKAYSDLLLYKTKKLIDLWKWPLTEH